MLEIQAVLSNRILADWRNITVGIPARIASLQAQLDRISAKIDKANNPKNLLALTAAHKCLYDALGQAMSAQRDAYYSSYKPLLALLQAAQAATDPSSGQLSGNAAQDADRPLIRRDLQGLSATADLLSRLAAGGLTTEERAVADRHDAIIAAGGDPFATYTGGTDADA
jgi:hypothetical protein